jgi:hypothetical protein
MSLLTPKELSLFYGNRNASVCHTRLAAFELRYPTGLYEKAGLMDSLLFTFTPYRWESDAFYHIAGRRLSSFHPFKNHTNISSSVPQK